MSDAPRCILAYSGGLDTSVAIRWLTEELGYEVITVTADLGEARDVESITDRALASGATRAHTADAREAFLEGFAFPTLMAGALYEGVYPLATALARPLIARLLVDIAREEGAIAIAHGCTGKGNDQVRFDVAVAALAPELRVVAPVRDWDMGRPDELRYAAEHGIDIGSASASPYSIDANLWGRAIECGDLEDPWQEPGDDVFTWTADPGDSPDGGAVVEISFEAGVPVSLDGERLEAVELVTALNTLAGAHGVGRVDHVENRLVGIKSREVYESPAATVLYAAHGALEALTLSRDVMRVKRTLADEWARLVYDGLWFGSLRSALWGFVGTTQAVVTGDVRLHCERGAVQVVGRRGPTSLYRPELATYDRADDRFDL
ncbi:MAG: argininosuccinate synthase, partial [Candidatus Dormibacteria bacterium]